MPLAHDTSCVTKTVENHNSSHVTAGPFSTIGLVYISRDSSCPNIDTAIAYSEVEACLVSEWSKSGGHNTATRDNAIYSTVWESGHSVPSTISGVESSYVVPEYVTDTLKEHCWTCWKTVSS